MTPSTLHLYQRHQNPVKNVPLTDRELAILKERLHDIHEFVQATNPAALGVLAAEIGVEQVMDARQMKL